MMSTQPCLRVLSTSSLRAVSRYSRQQVRHSSHAPMTVPKGLRPVTLPSLHKQYVDKVPLTMLTAHNYPSALIAQEAGIEIILVGDSLAMVSLGMPDTSEVTLEEMIIHARAVSRAATRAFTVGDLPMGSYEVSEEQAMTSAIRMVKEGRMRSVKLEGGKEMASTIRKITQAGIPVCGHIGLTPQRQNALGGFRVQGNTPEKAFDLLEDAMAIQDAGAFMLVLECVPPDVAEVVTDALSIPTIGIGAGSKTSGQVLVQIDMLGVRPPDAFMPKFVKKYSDEWSRSLAALQQYKAEVVDRSYPAPEHCYKQDQKVAEALRRHVQQRLSSETVQ